MWFHTVRKINKAAPGEASYESSIELRTLVKHTKIFLASSHTTSIAQSEKQHSRHKESHAVVAVCLHKKPSPLWASKC
jgi:heme/copper-type cytochrome/quinol oxidase subunit 3